MRHHYVGLGLVLLVLFLLLSFVSWSDSFVVKEGESISGNSGVLQSFSILSPLIIGMLIMGAVVLLIRLSVEDV